MGLRTTGVRTTGLRTMALRDRDPLSPLAADDKLRGGSNG
jgi:hypothetical protein